MLPTVSTLLKTVPWKMTQALLCDTHGAKPMVLMGLITELCTHGGLCAWVMKNVCGDYMRICE